MEDFSTLTIARRGSVAEITLTRPELLNRFDDPLHQEFTAALRSLRSERDLRAIVLASTGKVFSAGGDFELMKACNAELATAVRVTDDGRRLLMTLLDVPQPVVVAMQGPAIGVGATIVLACDAIVAARTAQISDPHVSIGLVAGDGGCLVWPQAAGMLRAKRHLLTGDALSAEDAFSMGLITDLVDTSEEVLPTARALADRIAQLPPIAVQGTKRALNRVLQQRAGEVLDLSFALEIQSLRSDDLLEAIAAFTERRPGNYHGK
jgi:enoyl-CoA hydratase